MNDLSATAGPRRCCAPIPPLVPRVLLPLFLAAVAVALLILVVVRNALLLGCVLLLSVLVLSFLLWNVVGFRRNSAVLLFLDRFPASDLRSAKDGQLVKITGLDKAWHHMMLLECQELWCFWNVKNCDADIGKKCQQLAPITGEYDYGIFASCADLSLESSYEKVGKCIYTSTLLYEYGRSGLKPENANNQCLRWNLTYLERHTADFHITDMRSGTRVLVKAGCNSKVTPLIKETKLVNTTSKNRELSSTLKKWLEERHLSAETRLLCLEEGYIKEGSSLTVMGILSRDDGVLVIVPPSEPISTGCFLHKFLLPTDVDGLVLKCSNQATSTANFINT